MGTTIGIFAHVDAGKTTLSEQVLYKGGSLRQLGRVDNKNAFLDYNEIERQRGITVFADEAPFTVNGSPFYLIDTPGHVDFSGEMERSIGAIDCAVLVISCVEGVQSHTETIWRLLQKNNIPTILFLNKADRDIADPNAVLTYIKNKWDTNAVVFDGNFTNGIMTDVLIEEIAATDVKLLECYLEHGYEQASFIKNTTSLIKNGIICPVVIGSALNGTGIDMLFEIFNTFIKTKPNSIDPFYARVYKVRHYKNGGRVVFIKVLNGKLKPKDEVLCPDAAGGTITYKVNEIRSYSGSKFKSVSQADQGELCAVTGLYGVIPGDIIGEGARKGKTSILKPLMAAKVEYDKNIHPQKMLQILREIEDEEPLLSVIFNEKLQEIHVQVMGEIQIEILKNILRQRFNVEASFGKCEILYVETIKNTVIASGHFEPLRHYAEVHLRLSPGERGTGVTFDSVCATDELSLNWQRLIETHVLEKQHKGVLTCSPLTDVHITLLNGRAHLKHTEGGDFRQATYRAIRQGLMQAENVLLEPWFHFEIEVEVALSGKVLMNIQKMGGKYNSPIANKDSVIITGICPVVMMQGYARDLAEMTKGKGKLGLTFDNYYPCENQEEIVLRKGYNPERDVENTPDSVFCSHGAGYTVKWDQATEMMHVKTR